MIEEPGADRSCSSHSVDAHGLLDGSTRVDAGSVDLRQLSTVASVEEGIPSSLMSIGCSPSNHQVPEEYIPGPTS